jgi:hypothetical protein
MNLTLARFEYGENQTIGALFNENHFLCYTLEDACRPKKILGKTAIPYGRYRVDFTWSGRFNRMLPILCDVPLFFGIRIHAGNTETSTEGCLLVGMDKQKSETGWMITRSVEAMEKVIIPLFHDPKEVTLINILGGYSAMEMQANA